MKRTEEVLAAHAAAHKIHAALTFAYEADFTAACARAKVELDYDAAYAARAEASVKARAAYFEARDAFIAHTAVAADAAYAALNKALADADTVYAAAREAAYTDLDAALDAAYTACADVAHTDAEQNKGKTK